MKSSTNLRPISSATADSNAHITHILISYEDNPYFSLYRTRLGRECKRLDRKNWVGFDENGYAQYYTNSPSVSHILIQNCSYAEFSAAITFEPIKFRVVEENEIAEISMFISSKLKLDIQSVLTRDTFLLQAERKSQISCKVEDKNKQLIPYDYSFEKFKALFLVNSNTTLSYYHGYTVSGFMTFGFVPRKLYSHYAKRVTPSLGLDLAEIITDLMPEIVDANNRLIAAFAKMPHFYRSEEKGFTTEAIRFPLYRLIKPIPSEDNNQNKKLVPDKYSYAKFKQLFFVEHKESDFEMVEISDCNDDKKLDSDVVGRCSIM